jgi:hypothetical protein
MPGVGARHDALAAARERNDALAAAQATEVEECGCDWCLSGVGVVLPLSFVVPYAFGRV